MKHNRNRKYGFARTKNYPLLNHPAYYKRMGNDNIEYITFTHSDVVDIDGEKIITKKLNVNINRNDKKEYGRNSYVMPRVYTGKRSSLRNELKGYKIDKTDKETVDNIFKSSIRIPVTYTSNSKKKK